MFRPIEYMPQLDGLRAIAVISVIVFHLNPSWLGGGYLGVDVFFILSGFLITKILYGDLIKGTYSWNKFITRRIRRLMPALMTMISAVIISSLFLLVFPHREQLVAQSTAAIFSYSNYFYYHTTAGYWGDDTGSIALLHTWSLAVEEQFYLIYPLFLFIVFKVFPLAHKRVIVALLLLALTGYLYVYKSNPDLAFYSLHTRTWQLLLGGCLALWNTNSSKYQISVKAQGYLGLGSLFTLCCCFAFLDHKITNNTDGWITLMPCLSAICLIWCCSYRSPALKILELKPMAYIGKVSYSLYLWHWPVIVMAKFLSSEPNILIIVLITMIFACSSYHFIERPMRHGNLSIFKISIRFLALPCLLTLLMSQIKTNPVVPNELKPMMNTDTIQNRKHWRCNKKKIEPIWGHKPCNMNISPLVIINGSSHARVLCGALNEYAQTHQYRFCSLSVASGGITQTSVKKGQNRAETNKQRNQIIRDLRPDILLVAGYWHSESTSSGGKFEEKLKIALRAYSKAATWVIVVGQSPRLDVPKESRHSIRKYYWSQYLQSDSGKITISADDSADKANALVRNVVESLDLDNVIYENPRHAFYSNSEFSAINKGRFLYSDQHHINDHSARLIIKKIWAQHADKLQRRK